MVWPITAGIAVEARLPESVAEDRDGMRAGPQIVGGGEEAADGGAESEQREVVSRDQLAVDDFGLPVDADRHAQRDSGTSSR